MDATLSAVPNPTPIVVVVTVIPDGLAPPTAAVVPPPASPTVEAGTATPALSPTVAASFAPSGAPSFADDFSTPGDWSLGEDATQRVAVADGRLEFSLKQGDRFGFIYDPTRRARDFVAVLTGSSAACQPRDRLGLIFRVQDAANYYQFELDCDGLSRLARVQQGALTVLKDWTASDAARPGPGAANELGVRAQGPLIEAAVNGQPVFRVQDEALTEGGFGLYAGSNPTSGFTANFDNLRVWVIP